MIGDTHFGHKNVIKWRAQFASEQEHSEYLCARWRETVTKDDTVYVLGDAAFTREGLLRFAGLPGRKILVRGNHDKFKALEYLVFFEDIVGIMGYKRAWLSHCPIHPDELRGRVNIHGHTHAGGPSGRYYSVCAEHIGMAPMRFSAIMERMSES